MDVRAEIVALYANASFQQTKDPADDVLRFENQFSIHFVFLFDSYANLAKNWKAVHEYLKEDYRDFTGPRDMEWNYYAIFVVTEPLANEKVFEALRSEIQAETSFSRKYVFSPRELDELPPGLIGPQQLRSKRVGYQDFIDDWKKTLGPELLDLLLKGSKRTVKKRPLSFIEGHLDER